MPWRFLLTLSLPHRAVWPPRHLGTGPAMSGALHHLVATALAVAASLVLSAPSKLRKIKHLHRKRGATHYRGQKPWRGKTGAVPRTRDPVIDHAAGSRADPGR